MTRALMALDAAIRYAGIAALAVSAACLLAIMVIGSVDAITTNLLSWALPAALESSEVLLAVCTFLSFAHAQNRQEHISVDLFIDITPMAVQRASVLLSLLCGAGVFILLAWRSWNLAVASWDIGEYANALITFPIYPAKFLVAIGAGIAALEFLRQLVWFVGTHGRSVGALPKDGEGN